jgi:glycosyltransferase involved in cell wall biosynthesis
VSGSASRRIAVVTGELRGFRPAGGAGTAMTFLALALARMGQSVEILLALQRADAVDGYWGSAYADAGIELRSVPCPDERVEPEGFAFARSAELGLLGEAPDVVIVHDFGAPAYSALRLRQARIGFENTLFVVFCHGTGSYLLDVSGRLSAKNLRHLLATEVFERASVELADVVVSPSAYLIEWMRGQQWQLPERTLVIPYFTRSSALGERAPAAPPTGDGRVRRLAFFGRLDERKGVEPFALALNALEPELLNELELEFIGKPTATWTPARVRALLSSATKRALRRVSFATGLDQHEALARLSREGTLAVIPTLYDNSPNTVYECLERAIPFIASNVGGIPELIAADDRASVLFEPNPAGVERGLRRALSGELRPARASFASSLPYERWADVVAVRPATRASAADARLEVDVVVRGRSPESRSRCLAALKAQTYEHFRVIPDLQAGAAPYVVFLDGDDVPDAELLATLVRAQAALGADVVSCAVRVTADGGNAALCFFAGDPGGPGVLANEYGTAALIRRSLLVDLDTPWPAEHDPDWPLLAGLAASGARVVSVPVPLVTRTARPGAAEEDPSDALLVLDRVERALPVPLRNTARLVAGLAANSGVAASARPAGFARRTLRRLVRSGG